MTWLIAACLTPLAIGAIAGVAWLVARFMPNGFLKRLLLLEIHDDRRYTLRESLRSLRNGR